MSDLVPWLALALWALALAFRVHPQTRRWAPRGMAGSPAGARADIPVPRAPRAGAVTDHRTVVPAPRERTHSRADSPREVSR